MIQKTNENITGKTESALQENQSGETLLREKIRKFLSAPGSAETPFEQEPLSSIPEETAQEPFIPRKETTGNQQAGKLHTFIDPQLFEDEISDIDKEAFLNTGNTDDCDTIIDAETESGSANGISQDFIFDSADEYINLAGKTRTDFINSISDEKKPETEVISLLKQELQWYYSRREDEKNRLKEIHQQRASIEDKFRKEEEELKDEIAELNKRKQEEKIKLQKIHENRLNVEEKYHQQERELRRAIEKLEERKLESIKQLDLLEQKRRQDEDALKQLTSITQAELDQAGKKIEQEKQNLHTLKTQVLTAKEKCIELDLQISRKKEELEEQQQTNAKIIARLNEEMKKTEQETESMREKIFAEINELIQRRDQIQHQFDTQLKEFDIFKKNKLNEKERLEDELNRILKYCKDEREILFSLKEQKIKSEKQNQQQKKIFEQQTIQLIKDKEELEFQINQIKQSFAQEYVTFKEKKQELQTEQENLKLAIEEKQELLKSITKDIERARKDCEQEKEKTALEIEEINQEQKLAMLKLAEIRKNIDEQTAIFSENEVYYNEKLSQLRKEIADEEQKLFTKRESVIEQKRQLDLELEKTKKEHKDIIDFNNEEIQELQITKNRIQNLISQLNTKKDIAEEELKRIAMQKDNICADIEELKMKFDKEKIAVAQQQASIQRETDSLKSLRKQEEEELERLNHRRQQAEEEYHIKMRSMESEIENLSHKKLELKLKSE